MDEKFCNICSLQEGDTYEVSVGSWTTLEATREDGEILLLARGDGLAKYRPKYCPVCGRQLYKDRWED